jgi:hypothetical protein
MLARITGRAVVDLSEIHPVLEKIGERSSRERNAADDPSARKRPSSGYDPSAAEIVDERPKRAEFEIAVKDDANGLRFRFIDDKLSLNHPVAERNDAADPDALPLRGGDLVADAFPRDFPLELGEGEQHIERQSPHAGRGIECLRDGNERNARSVERLHELGEVGKRTRQAIHLVDYNNVDPPCSDDLEQGPEGRTLQIAA